MRYTLAVLAGCLVMSASAIAQVPAEVEACRLSGLVAIKERSPSLNQITLDVETLAISKADTKVGDTPIANFQLPLGIREVTFRHPQFGERRMPVTVKGDSASAVSIDFTKPQAP